MLYETQSDLVAEDRIAESLAVVWRCNQRKSDNAWVDREFLRNGKVVAVAEIKRRHNRKDAYPTYKIDVDKLHRGARLSSEIGVPFLLVVRFQDVVCHTVVDEIKMAGWEISIIRRKDRGDAFDVDKCYEIPLYDLKEIPI